MYSLRSILPDSMSTKITILKWAKFKISRKINKGFKKKELSLTVNFHIDQHRSERNQIYADIVPNFAYNNEKEWYGR